MKENLIASSSASSSDKLSSLKANSVSMDSPTKTSHTQGFSKEDQLKMAREYLEKPLIVGDKWYLVNSDWFTRWLKYIGHETASSAVTSLTKHAAPSNISPEKINNKSLLEFNEVLKKNVLKESLLEV